MSERLIAKQLLCLDQENSVELRAVMRDHTHKLTRLKQVIIESMKIQPKGHEVNVQPVTFFSYECY